MSLKDYLAHYFAMPDFLVFLLLAAALLICFFFVFFAIAKSKANKAREENRFLEYTERFYEIIFSSTSILLFISSYYLINRFVVDGPFREFWDKYKDFLLLVMIIIAVICNNLMDRLIVRLKHISPEDLAANRLAGMLYMCLIFCYIKFIYQDDNYDMFIAYFLTLMVGRFVYFDASFHDFLDNIKRVFINLPIMFMALIYTSIMCLVGFSTGYLLKHNGVVTNIFFTHLFMCVVIIVLQFVPKKIFAKRLAPARRKKKEAKSPKNRGKYDKF